MEGTLRHGPLIRAGLLLGIGLGGFLDGIVFHQILQLHSMMSARIPPINMAAMRVNMTWDGYFHFAVWLATAAGLFAFFRAGQQADAVWSGKTLLGALLAGWGAFNLIEGIVDHHILGIHHVVEYAVDKLPYDLAFLASGIVLLLLGWALIRADKKSVQQRPATG